MDYPDLGQDACDGLKTSTFVKAHTQTTHVPHTWIQTCTCMPNAV